ncbi:YiiX/YebB-like N1pC/P60 family cysteine hydrolase [Xanthomonas sp. 3307]|uniref:YiiX/YebB-like N1pC/P60 family cysteine hydrolase n=1 Tax=Xanthomonas sp. 3307 TaxID=3035316 RepID=UPI001620B77B|nr:YiiX/YebB-like N1pC/P60 family cysteine hydrolase [Xanthomonas sp. 3307]MBB5941911.1 hypothetical protein [Xanthomonas sp. 3307]
MISDEGWSNSDLYTYDIPSLRKGDVILSTSPEKNSSVIRKVTKSPYSHAMLYVGKTIIHADGDGVFTTNPQRRLFPSGTSIVLRHLAASDQQLEYACQFSRNLAGTLYSVPQAILTILFQRTDFKSLNNSQFCSRLVAQAYFHAGIPVVKNADYCSPGELARSESFALVASAIRLATPAELEISKRVDTVKVHQINTYAWLRPFSKAVHAAGLKAPTSIVDAFNFVFANRDYDERLAGLLEASGYLKDYELDKVANPHRYSIDEFVRILTDNFDAVPTIISSEFEISLNIFNNAFSQFSQFNGINLRSFRLLTEMHLQRMIQARDRAIMIHSLAKTWKLDELASDSLRAHSEMESKFSTYGSDD